MNFPISPISSSENEIKYIEMEPLDPDIFATESQAHRYQLLGLSEKVEERLRVVSALIWGLKGSLKAAPANILNFVIPAQFGVIECPRHYYNAEIL